MATTATVPTRRRPDPPPLTVPTALVVDPDPRARWNHRLALEAAGYDVTSCPGPTVAACPVLSAQRCPRVPSKLDLLLLGLGARCPDASW